MMDKKRKELLLKIAKLNEQDYKEVVDIIDTCLESQAINKKLQEKITTIKEEKGA